MKKILIAAFISLTSLYAHAQKDLTPCELTTQNYSCDNGDHSFELTRKDKDTVKLLDNDNQGNPAILKRQESGSGEKFSGAGYELSLKGNEGMLIYKKNGESHFHENCKIE